MNRQIQVLYVGPTACDVQPSQGRKIIARSSQSISNQLADRTSKRYALEHSRLIRRITHDHESGSRGDNRVRLACASLIRAPDARQDCFLDPPDLRDERLRLHKNYFLSLLCCSRV